MSHRIVFRSVRSGEFAFTAPAPGPVGSRMESGYRSPGRRATRDKLRAIAYPTAVNCPPIFAEDKEFMRLFWASKRIEHDPRQREKFDRLRGKLYARGVYLEAQDRKSAEEKSS